MNIGGDPRRGELRIRQLGVTPRKEWRDEIDTSPRSGNIDFIPGLDVLRSNQTGL